MPIQATQPNTVPELTYDKVLIRDCRQIGFIRDGVVGGFFQLSLQRYTYDADGKAVLDPAGPKTYRVEDVFAEAETNPAFAALLQQQFALFAQINTALQLV